MKNYGFIPDKIDLEKDYVLGSLRSAPYEVLREDGQWLDFLPDNETQRQEGVETMACTIFNTLNPLEILFRRKFNETKNWAERFIAVLAGLTQQGGTPQNAAEAIRKNGNIDDYYLPFSINIKTWDEYCSPKPMTENYLVLGRKWLNEFEMRHEWVFTDRNKDKKEKLMSALKTSPVGVSVYAWVQNPNGVYYKPQETQDNHWTCLIGYKENEYWIVYDSYEPFIKHLDWSFDFGQAKRYFIEKKPTIAQLSLIEQILVLMYKAVGFLSQLVAKKQAVVEPAPIVEPNIVSEPEKPAEAPTPPKYLWDNHDNARHSVRVICDEEGMSVAQKNEICAVIECESGFKTNAFHKNNNGTADFGICQYNSYYFIGLGKPIASIDEAINNPEKCVRVICLMWKKKRMKDWVCYKKLFLKGRENYKKQ